MEVMKDIMSKNGIDLDQIRKSFYEVGGDNCDDSIKKSKAYIIIMCSRQKKTMWDFVRDEMAEVNSDKDYSDYQKTMANSALLLAWEDLEKNDEELCSDIHHNAKQHEK